MRSLLEDLRHSPTPLAVTSRENLARQAKAAYIALLEVALSVDTEGDANIPSDLRRYALWLEDAASDDAIPTDEQERAYRLSASLYEFVGRMRQVDDQPNIFRGSINDLLRSALAGSMTGYQAQAATVARRIGAMLRSYAVPDPQRTNAFHLEISITLVSLLARDYLDCFSRGLRLRRLAEESVEELRDRDAPAWETVAVDQALALGLSSATFAVGMLVGASRLLDVGMRGVGAAKRAAFETADSERYWLTDRVLRDMQTMSGASMHRILRQHRLPDSFRRSMARSGILELWAPQREAIDKGLLESDNPPHMLISIPTGSGKTLVAEMAILNALTDDPAAWAIYVTPSRALVNQVSNDLRRRLRDSGISVRTVLAGAEQAVLISEEIEFLAAARTVTVLTPEKLDAYYRNAGDQFDSCRLAIFDEVHKLAEADRGPLIESLISRFLVLQPETRILLLSGVVSNYDEIENWLGANTASVVVRDRPNRQIRGLAVRHDARPSRERTREGHRFRRIDFSGGLALVHEEEDLNAALEMQVPDVFQGHYTQELTGRGWAERPKRSRTTRNDHAVQIAERLSGTPGTILVFTQTTIEAASSCGAMSIHIGDEGSTERERLAAFIASELGDDHELVGYCRSGKAYHHSRLPTVVQRGIELGLDQGWLRAVFATGTLKEGMNTPASYVIVAGDAFFDEAREEMVPLAESDFENLAGRAGRPFRETEGLVVLVPNNLATARTSGGRYLLVGEEALRARSQLDRLARWLERGPVGVGALPIGDQSLMLGLKAAGIADADRLGKFFERTLWAVQEDDAERPVRVAAAALRSLAATAEEIGEDRLTTASRTGLSLTSVEVLYGTLSGRLDAFAPVENPEEARDQMLAILLESIFQIPELRRGYLDKDIEWSCHLAALKAWISGDRYEQILAAAVENGALGARAKLGDAVKYASDMATWISWVLGAAGLVLASLTEELDPWLGTLPLLVKYGVSTPSAAIVSLLGVSDRYAAQLLADRFTSTGRPASLNEVSEWLTDIDDELEGLFESGSVRLELLRRLSFGVREPPLPYVFTRASGPNLRPSQVFSLTTDGASIHLNRNGERAGEFADVDLVQSFSQGSPESVVAVCTSTPRDDVAAVVLIRPRVT